MRKSLILAGRSLLAVVAGFVVISIGTIITFNLLVGQVTISSTPAHMFFGTVGAVISGLAGGAIAGLIAPRAPILHALGIWIPIAVDTTSIVMRGTGPVWFDIAGSGILALTALVGGFFVKRFKAR